MANEIKKNEFDDLDAPNQEFSGNESMLSTSPKGEVYDWTQAPEGIKAPPRKDMHNMVTTVKDVQIILPPKEDPWITPRKGGTNLYKACGFRVTYDYEGQVEFYSGTKVFKRNDKYSHPTLPRDGKSQVSRLLFAYAKFVNKNPEEIPLKEFLGFLHTKPKVKITKVVVVNPKTNELVNKNIIDEFVK